MMVPQLGPQASDAIRSPPPSAKGSPEKPAPGTPVDHGESGVNKCVADRPKDPRAAVGGKEFPHPYHLESLSRNGHGPGRGTGDAL